MYNMTSRVLIISPEYRYNIPYYPYNILISQDRCVYIYIYVRSMSFPYTSEPRRPNLCSRLPWLPSPGAEGVQFGSGFMVNAETWETA